MRSGMRIREALWSAAAGCRFSLGPACRLGRGLYVSWIGWLSASSRNQSGRKPSLRAERGAAALQSLGDPHEKHAGWCRNAVAKGVPEDEQTWNVTCYKSLGLAHGGITGQ